MAFLMSAETEPNSGNTSTVLTKNSYERLVSWSSFDRETPGIAQKLPFTSVFFHHGLRVLVLSQARELRMPKMI